MKKIPLSFETAPCGGCTVEVRNLSVEDKGDVILKDVTFSLHCGELLAVIGPNGGGKTTLVRSILGLRPHSGTVRFFSADGSERPLRIGYVPQSLDYDHLAPMTVGDFLSSALSKRPVFFGTSKKLRQQHEQLLEEVKVGRLLDRRLGMLSGGELQRVMLALALSPMPELLLLDEPVSGIDASGLELFYSILDGVRRKHHLSILLVSHDLRLVEKHADRAALIDRTLKICASPSAVFRSKEFEESFGILAQGGDRS